MNAEIINQKPDQKIGSIYTKSYAIPKNGGGHYKMRITDETAPNKEGGRCMVLRSLEPVDVDVDGKPLYAEKLIPLETFHSLGFQQYLASLEIKPTEELVSDTTEIVGSTNDGGEPGQPVEALPSLRIEVAELDADPISSLPPLGSGAVKLVDLAEHDIKQPLPDLREKVISDGERRNHEAAEAKVKVLLGKNNKGGGALGDILRRYGVTPAEIRTILSKPENREAAIGAIERLFDDKSLSAQFGSRVGRDQTKQVAKPELHDGVDEMNSLRYVAELVYNKLSGVFDVGSDVKLDQGDGAVDQHRGAAEKTISYYQKMQSEVEAPVATHETIVAIRELVGPEIDSFKAALDMIGRKVQNVADSLNGRYNDSESSIHMTDQVFLDIDSLNQYYNSVLIKLDSRDADTLSEETKKHVESIAQAMVDVHSRLLRVADDSGHSVQVLSRRLRSDYSLGSFMQFRQAWSSLMPKLMDAIYSGKRIAGAL